MLTEGTVVLTVITGKSSIAVEAVAIINAMLYTANGSSKCDSTDSFDREIGMQLAVGRAVRQLGRDIYRDGNEAVKRNDAIRAKQIEEQERLRVIKAAKAKVARKEYLAKYGAANPKRVNKTLAKVGAKR